MSSFDWSRYPEEAEAAWCEYNHSGNPEPVYKVIQDAAERVDTRKLFQVMLWALTLAYPNNKKSPAEG